MTFSSAADEVFYHLQALDRKSDILSHLPMAAYVVRADGELHPDLISFNAHMR
jgi:hypothetical protein